MPGRDADVRSRPQRFLNRELSWLEFNARVLALAEDPSRPLLERAKFCAIFSSNLDEFFQVRVSGLEEQLDLGVRSRSPDGLDAAEAVRTIREQARALVERQTTIFTKDLAPALEEEGVRFPTWEELDDDDRESLRREFEERVYPVLTPLAVDPAHPFPYISNLSLNLAAVVRDPATGEDRFARVKVPPVLPRFVPLPDGERFIPLEHLIAAHLDRLFPGMEVVAHYPFRVTRDADFELDDEAEDLLEAIETVLQRRTRFGNTIRLEIDTTMSDDVLDVLSRELEVPPGATEVVDGPLDLAGLFDVCSLDRPDLKAEQWSPQTQHEIAPTNGGQDIFRTLRSGDLLVHHPYDSFASSVEAFVKQAARDERVLAIKQTIYRTAGAESGIVQSLIDAAREDKQVVALVELKARFDEQANIERARILEEAGVHVVYGLVGLKTHAKILLVVRQDEDGVIRRYCHVGTGNYNPKTAELYEDLGLLTCDPDVGTDLTELFNHLTGYSRPSRYRRLLVAPESMRPGLRDRIRAEAAQGRRRSDRAEDEQPRRRRAHRRALRRVERGHADRSRRARHLLPAPTGARAVREHPGALDRRLLPRALAHLLLRRRSDDRRVPHRLGRLDAAQPRPPRRGPDRGHRFPAAGAARRDPRRSTSPTTCSRGSSRATARGTRSPRWWASTRSSASASSRKRAPPTHECGRVSRAARPIEREVKLAVSPEFVLPSLTDPGGDVFAGPEETLELRATYFDTDDYRLSRAGASVRSRDDGWTVKLPNGMDGDALVRDELPVAGPLDAKQPPDEALDLVRALTRGAPVEPVAELHTTRRRVRAPHERRPRGRRGRRRPGRGPRPGVERGHRVVPRDRGRAARGGDEGPPLRRAGPPPQRRCGAGRPDTQDRAGAGPGRHRAARRRGAGDHRHADGRARRARVRSRRRWHA